MLIEHAKLDRAASANPILDRFRTAIRKEIPAVVAISAAVNLLLLTSSIYMLLLLDRVLASGSMDTLLYLTLMALVALAVYGGLEYNRRQILSRAGAFTDQQLTPAIFSQMIQRGAIGDRRFKNALSGASNIRSFLSGDNALAFADAPWTPIFLIAIALIHPALGLIALLGIVILFGITLLHAQVARPISLQERKEVNQINTRGNEAVAAADTIQAIGMRRAIVEGFRRAFTARLGHQIKGRDALSAWLALSRYFRFALQIAILGAGAALVIGGSTTPGGMIAASILLTRAVAPVEKSMSAWQAMVLARVGWQEVKTLLDFPDNDAAQVTLPALQGSLFFEDVAVVQPGRDQYLFHSLTGVVPPGSVVMVIGPSGSGKTTLARLILGVGAPSRGRISLDNASVSQWLNAQMGDQVGYLPQSVDILSGTVAENIARFGNLDEKAVLAAAQAADIHEMIAGLPLGYQTRIGPEGRRFSGGQLQRVALARALYGDPHVIVLDEPTSGQDQQGVAALVEATKSARRRGAIIVLVTHNPELAKLGDYLISLQSRQAKFYRLNVEGEPELAHSTARKLSSGRRLVARQNVDEEVVEKSPRSGNSEQEQTSPSSEDTSSDRWQTHTTFEHQRENAPSRRRSRQPADFRRSGQEGDLLRRRTPTDPQNG